MKNIILISLFASCICCSKSDQKIVFNAVSPVEGQYSGLHQNIQSAYVIDTAWSITIERNMFVEMLQMDWYLFHISEYSNNSDTLISFFIDKEGDIDSYIENRQVDWGEIRGENWFHIVEIQKDSCSPYFFN